MYIKVITVGKSHDPKISQAIDEYAKRLSRYVKMDWHVIPASSIQDESAGINKLLNGSYVILLDERGVELSTPEFADRLEKLQNNSVKKLTFVIGGAFGVTEDVKKRADFIWSLSPLVFPHQLVRLVLVEQLYRAYDIMHGGSYHHS